MHLCIHIHVYVFLSRTHEDKQDANLYVYPHTFICIHMCIYIHLYVYISRTHEDKQEVVHHLSFQLRIYSYPAASAQMLPPAKQLQLPPALPQPSAGLRRKGGPQERRLPPPRRATHCNTLQHTATHCNTLQHTATHCNTLHHTATHCNTLQHSAICPAAPVDLPQMYVPPPRLAPWILVPKLPHYMHFTTCTLLHALDALPQESNVPPPRRVRSLPVLKLCTLAVRIAMSVNCASLASARSELGTSQPRSPSSRRPAAMNESNTSTSAPEKQSKNPPPEVVLSADHHTRTIRHFAGFSRFVET